MSNYDLFLNRHEEYKIRIKKCNKHEIHLGERPLGGKILIHSLPYRDCVSAANQLVLLANLGDFDVTKKVGIANQMVLGAAVPILARKETSAFDKMVLSCRASVASHLFFAGANSLGITATASTGLRRKRLISDVADTSIADSGKMSLQEFFYITLM